VTFAAGGCVRGQATLVDTPAPELCMLNVVFDGTDADAFLASLGSGLPGTYVLRPWRARRWRLRCEHDVPAIQPRSFFLVRI
jgi:hypothetical protein